MAEYSERRRAAAASSQSGSVQRDPRVEKDFPALWDLMTTTKLKDGKVRRTMTVLLFVDDGKWKACLNDRENGVTAFVSGDTAQALLMSIEEGLQGDSLEWRGDRKASGRKG